MHGEPGRGVARVGCSGWHYRDWRGVVYPVDLGPSEWFGYYTLLFDTVELNNTFYRLPSREAVDEWAHQAPADFLYALKLGQFGSHRKKLLDARTWLPNHVDRASRFGPTLGPTVVQLPPRWRRNTQRLDEFLEAAPTSMRWAIEVRDPSWLHDDTFEVLRRHGAALCIHDLLADHPYEITTDWTYVRFHGPNATTDPYRGRYGADALRRWASRLAAELDAGHDVYAYFNNTTTTVQRCPMRSGSVVRSTRDHDGGDSPTSDPPEQSGCVSFAQGAGSWPRSAATSDVKGGTVRAAVWQGRHKVSVDTVPDPTIQSPTDAIIRVTSSGLCGSDLHLYEVLAPFMTPGDILGHEPMGIVEAVGSAVTNIAVGDRVVIPFGIACGHCFMCDQGLQSQCETTQVHDHGCGAALFGYTKLYGQVPGGQAELLRVPHADYGPIKVPHGPADDRFLFMSDVLPTAWQSVQYADVPEGGSLVVLGLGPIGDMACRIAQHLGVENVIGIDLVAERLERARLHGVDVADVDEFDDDAALIESIRERTNGRGPDAVIDAVGMEAHGSSGAKMAQAMTALMPDALTEKLMKKAGVDRLAALHLGIDLVRRGGTVSIVGVYGGMTDPMPMMTLFDKQIQIRMGQANVRRWVDDILPLLTDDDPLGVDTFATHHVPLEGAADAYEMFQKKQDGAIKVVFNP